MKKGKGPLCEPAPERKKKSGRHVQREKEGPRAILETREKGAGRLDLKGGRGSLPWNKKKSPPRRFLRNGEPDRRE